MHLRDRAVHYGIPEAPDGDDAIDLIERHPRRPAYGRVPITQDPPPTTLCEGCSSGCSRPAGSRRARTPSSAWRARQLDGASAGRPSRSRGSSPSPSPWWSSPSCWEYPRTSTPTFKHQLGVEHPDPGVGQERPSRSTRWPSCPRPSARTWRTGGGAPRRRAHQAGHRHLPGRDGARGPRCSRTTFLFAAGQDTTARLITAAPHPRRGPGAPGPAAGRASPHPRLRGGGAAAGRAWSRPCPAWPGSPPRSAAWPSRPGRRSPFPARRQPRPQALRRR